MPKIRAHNDPEFRYRSNNRTSLTEKYIPELTHHFPKHIKQKKKKDLQEEVEYIASMTGEIVTYKLSPEDIKNVGK